MPIRPTGVVFDGRDVQALAEFWHRATGYEVIESEEWFAHLVPAGTGLDHIFINRIEDQKSAKNRCHLDFESDDRESDVERLVSAGATRLADHSEGEFNWTVLQYPEGNEFCIASPIGE